MQIDRLEQTRSELDSHSSSLCLAKWLQATLHLYNGNTQSCHHVKSHRIPKAELESNPAALHNTSKKLAARRQMLSGQRPSECDYCWKVEDLGQYSDRIYKSADTWAYDKVDEVVKEQEGRATLPTYLEVAFDNICNLKCVYCSPAYSSSWHNEIKQHGPYPTSKRYNNLTLAKVNKVLPLPEEQRHQYIDAFWKWWPELSQHLRHLRVTGGEPLLTRHTWQLIDSLIANPQPQLNFDINSNLSLPEKVIEKLSGKINELSGKIQHFTLYCSIDATGPQAEYIRTGLDYKQFCSNLELILDRAEKKITVSFMITMNALSVSGLPSLVRLIYDLKTKYPQHHIGIDTPYLRHPEHLSVQILPKVFSKYLDETLKFMNQHLMIKPGFVTEDIQRIERVREIMLNNSWSRFRKAVLRRDLMKMLVECDKRRGLNHYQAFPEYADFFKKSRFFAGWI